MTAVLLAPDGRTLHRTKTTLVSALSPLQLHPNVRAITERGHGDDGDRDREVHTSWCLCGWRSFHTCHADGRDAAEGHIAAPADAPLFHLGVAPESSARHALLCHRAADGRIAWALATPLGTHADAPAAAWLAAHTAAAHATHPDHTAATAVGAAVTVLGNRFPPAVGEVALIVATPRSSPRWQSYDIAATADGHHHAALPSLDGTTADLLIRAVPELRGVVELSAALTLAPLPRLVLSTTADPFASWQDRHAALRFPGSPSEAAHRIAPTLLGEGAVLVADPITP